MAKKPTEALTNPIEGFVYSFSNRLAGVAFALFIGTFLFFIGLYSIGVIIVGCAFVVAIVMLFIGASKFRTGKCPYCGIKAKGIIKDNGITCNACNRQIIVKDNTFNVV